MLVFLIALMLQLGVDPDAPMSRGAWYAILLGAVSAIGTLLVWVQGYIKIREYRATEKRRKVEEEAAAKKRAEEEKKKHEELIRAVCKEILRDDDYLLSRERQMIKTAGDVVDEEFRVRSSSFASSEAFRTMSEMNERRFATLEKNVSDIRTYVEKAPGQIADEVINRLRQERV